MQEITNKGNLPKPLQVMAKEHLGERSTLFFECSSVDELLQLAANGECEETTVVVDRKNERGYITAFNFKDTDVLDLSGDKLYVMRIYYTELNKNEISKYSKMLHEHRQQQEDSHTKWKNKQKSNGENNE